MDHGSRPESECRIKGRAGEPERMRGRSEIERAERMVMRF